MKNRIDNILLGVLWLLAITLGTSFWFNTQFGFNIFSGAHWQHLAYLQAAQTPVRPMFYVSLALAVFIMIGGLYVLMRPQFRKIRLPINKTARKHHFFRKDAFVTKSDGAPNSTANNDASRIDTPPAEIQPAPPAPTQKTTTVRPPRLILPTMNNYISAPTAPTLSSASAAVPSATPSQDYPEIHEIFKSAGYVVKPNKKIGGVPLALMAIGTNETLWVGAVGVPTTDLRRAIDKLSQVFSDTLDDIYININGFVISAPDAATSEFQDILMFSSVSQLREYMRQFPNPPVPDDDQGNFDAYSEYIDTVLNYIGKI